MEQRSESHPERAPRSRSRWPRGLAALALCLVAGLARAEGERLPAPAPSDAEWRAIPWDPTESFGEEEIATWSAERWSRRALGLVGLGLGLAFYLVMLGPGGRRLAAASDRLARRLGDWPPLGRPGTRGASRLLGRLFGDDWARSLLFVLGYVLAGAAVSLPLWVAAEVLDRRAGLSSYTTSEWIVDLLKAEAMAAAALAVAALGLFGLIRRMPRRWWLAVGLVGAALLVGYGVLAPARARVFHDFRPLEDEALERRIEAVAARQGVRLAAVRVVEASRVTTCLDAYVTGEGPSRELVLFDTLLERVGPDEVVVAVAHELGHERRRRPLLGHLLSGAALVVMLWLVALVLRRAAPRLGLAGPGDVRALPLVMLVASLLFLAARPVALARSRHEERLADRAALVATEDPDAFVRLQLALARANHAELRPHPLVVSLYGSHPPVAERVGTALWYRGWLEARDRGGPP